MNSKQPDKELFDKAMTALKKGKYEYEGEKKTRDPKAQVRMPNGPLKTVGEHTVTVAPHSDVVVEVKVVVLGETA